MAKPTQKDINILILNSLNEVFKTIDPSNPICFDLVKTVNDLSEKKESKPTKSIEERRNDFEDLANTVNMDNNILSMDQLSEFIGYWTEHGPNDKLMRFEQPKNKSFDMSRRLKARKRMLEERYGNSTNNKSGVTNEERSRFRDKFNR